MDATNTAQTPALLTRTALDLFAGVLNPDDYVNGKVPLTISGQSVPVRGVYFDVGNSPENAAAGRSLLGVDGETVTTGMNTHTQILDAGTRIAFKRDGAGTATGPDVRADMSAVEGEISLADLYNAETIDKLTRRMRAFIDANPVDGEEQILRWAFGLSVDSGKTPWLLSYKRQFFGQEFRRATDELGFQNETSESRNGLRMEYAVPVPRTELGGIVVTFASVKPDETLLEQPHPILAAEWKVANQVAEELLIDPVPVTAREVDSSVDPADEGNIVFYTGYNGMKRNYTDYGFNREIDPGTVDGKNALWQYEIPISVSPENIVYPDDIPHDPFYDTLAEVASYSLRSDAVVVTPMVFGPSPVEEVAVIRDENLFEDQPVSEESEAL